MPQQILAILLVLGLLAATLYLLRRKGFAQFRAVLPNGSGRARQIAILDRIALGPQHSLHLVEIRKEVLLIGVSPAGCNRIASFETSMSSSAAEALPPC